MTRALRILVLLLALAAGACSLPKNEAILPTIHDLGPARAYAVSNPAIAATIALPQVTAPAWLDDSVIVYRLAYEDASRQHAYNTSRWAAAPAELLTERLRSRFGAVAKGAVSPLDSARSDYTLRVELRDFSQAFDAPGSSQVTVRARASLIATAERALVTQREFEVRRPAAPNADGAVKALTEATESFLEELVKWTVENAKGATGTGDGKR